ncbi:MAG: cyclic nucleotide-binding domain-containing protein [Chloroflexi bacterium]|nr:cyclic nucleotide-binding domain-containing protein [Chloroflexota bacterium]
MKRSVTATLSLTEIFDNLSSAQLELIAALCEPMVLRRGQVLFRENEGSDDLYVIVRGAIEVLMNPGVITSQPEQEPVALTGLRPGQVFGEIALVDQGVRSATIRASEDNTELLRIPRDRLMRLCDTYPELGYKIMRNLAADLALKIRNTGLTIRQYQLLLSGQQKPPAR